MCGFAGIFGHGRQQNVNQEVIAKMRDAMVHRGPDGAGIWISNDRRVAFGHRRLSFLDLSETANQPMANEDGRVWIVFNGEIYNHAELRPELVAAGHKFRTDHSDTEVLIHGFEEWGMEGLLSRLYGDFAFAIYSQAEDALYFARDRAGVKPLYFSKLDGEFIFASEVKAILEHPMVERDINPIAMNHYLSFMTTPAPMTMFKGISKLPAGTWMKVTRDGSIDFHRYFHAEPRKGIDSSQVSGLSEAALEEFYTSETRRRLFAAIEKRMVSDVPIGVFLSGGVDSSTNLAMMTELSDKPIETFTVGFKDFTDLNELHFARKAAKHFGANYHEVLIDEDDMMAYLDRLIYSQDEPLADWVCIPLYFVSKLAHDSGVKGVQVGEGADEQFCGYSSYMGYLKLYHTYFEPFRKWLPGPIKRAIGATAVKALGSNSSFAPYVDVIDRAARDREHFWTGAMVFWNAQKEHVIHPDAIMSESRDMMPIEAGMMPASYNSTDSYNVIEHFLTEFDGRNPSEDALTRMIHNEMRLRLPELLLMRVDKITMSESLEARVPFLDHDMIDFSFDIPERWKTKGGMSKYILKKSVEGLIPDELIYRKKMGFAAPMADWLRGKFGQQAISRITSSKLVQRGFLNYDYIQKLYAEHVSGRADSSTQLWTVYNLTAWYDYWIDGSKGQRG
jgi:asparagine synthase (glutamine-hydrolysing)